MRVTPLFMSIFSERHFPLQPVKLAVILTVHKQNATFDLNLANRTHFNRLEAFRDNNIIPNLNKLEMSTIKQDRSSIRKGQ